MRRPERGKDRLVEGHEGHLFHRARLQRERPDLGDRDSGGGFERIAVDAAADGWKRDGVQRLRRRQRQR